MINAMVRCYWNPCSVAWVQPLAEPLVPLLSALVQATSSKLKTAHGPRPTSCALHPSELSPCPQVPRHAHTHLGGQVLEGAPWLQRCQKSIHSHTTLCLSSCCRLLLVIVPLLLFVVFACVSICKTQQPPTPHFPCLPKSQRGFGKVFTACCLGESSLMMRSSTSSVFPLTARRPKEDLVGSLLCSHRWILPFILR